MARIEEEVGFEWQGLKRRLVLNGRIGKNVIHVLHGAGRPLVRQPPSLQSSPPAWPSTDASSPVSRGRKPVPCGPGACPIGIVCACAPTTSAILLDAGGAQSVEAIAVDLRLP